MIFKELLVIAILLSCEPKTPESSAPNNTQVVDTVYHIDLSHPTLTQDLDSTYKNPEQMKFVEVEITHVVNPKEYPVLFSVDFISVKGESSQLGVFSLYPSTNPGTFIIATQGMLRSFGKLELRLERPEEFVEGNIIEVEVKRIRLKR